MIAFTSSGIKLAKCIFLVKFGEAHKFEDDRLNFMDTKTVVVNKELYAFKDGNPVSAFKFNIAHFNSTD